MFSSLTILWEQQNVSTRSSNWGLRPVLGYTREDYTKQESVSPTKRADYYLGTAHGWHVKMMVHSYQLF